MLHNGCRYDFFQSPRRKNGCNIATGNQENQHMKDYNKTDSVFTPEIFAKTPSPTAQPGHNDLSVFLLWSFALPSALTLLIFNCSPTVLLSYAGEQLENSWETVGEIPKEHRRNIGTSPRLA